MRTEPEATAVGRALTATFAVMALTAALLVSGFWMGQRSEREAVEGRLAELCHVRRSGWAMCVPGAFEPASDGLTVRLP